MTALAFLAVAIALTDTIVVWRRRFLARREHVCVVRRLRSYCLLLPLEVKRKGGNQPA